jgi:hypothetical protein
MSSQLDLLNKPKKKKKAESLLKTDKRALGSKKNASFNFI